MVKKVDARQSKTKDKVNNKKNANGKTTTKTVSHPSSQADGITMQQNHHYHHDHHLKSENLHSFANCKEMRN